MTQTLNKPGTSVSPNAARRPGGVPVDPATPGKARDPELSRILGLGVPVAVVLAERDLAIESILQITVGTILEFEVSFGADLSLVVGNRTIGGGVAVKVGEHFGLRISTIDTVQHRIDAMAHRQGTP